MISTALDKNIHNREKFDCTIVALNTYLKLTANQQSLKDNSRTYIIEGEDDKSIIVGFYTLSMISVNLEKLPNKLQKKHKNSTSAGLIARLAVDKQYANKGIGSLLLIDALQKLLNASDTVGFAIVIVDAKDGVKSFYEKFGFKSFENEKNRLFISISDIRASFMHQK